MYRRETKNSDKKFLRETEIFPEAANIYYIYIVFHFIVVQSLSLNSATPLTPTLQNPLPSSIYQSLLKFMSIELMKLSIQLILCCPFSFCLQPFPALGSFPLGWLSASGGQSIGIFPLWYITVYWIQFPVKTMN